jgi:hypothetical protein
MDYLYKFADSNKLPIINQANFEHYTNTIGKEQFRLDLAEYIAKERPKFPLKKITLDDVRKSFFDLQKQDISDYCKDDDNVMEKYSDYKYSYKEYGLGIIDAPSTYNNISNYFHQSLRLNCSSYSFKAPIDVWTNGTAKDIWRCLGPIWRGINNMKKKVVEGKEILLGGELTESSYMSAFRLGTYIATQFKPNVARTIYDLTNANKVLDTSCGWGDRLAGFYTSNARQYTGCDPNPNTYQNYMEQVELYEEFLGNKDVTIYERVDNQGRNYFECMGKKYVRIYRCGAEDLPWDEIKDIDCSFTSPPYFSTEEYNKGGENEEDQSWFKFNEYEKWRDSFFLPVSQKCFERSKHTLVNIMDPTIKGKRYRSCDELVDMLKDNFIGQIGMRIMQRPKSDKLFEDEKAKQEFMNKTFIENVWCFSKDKDVDFFKSTRRGNLSSFFE